MTAEQRADRIRALWRFSSALRYALRNDDQETADEYIDELRCLRDMLPPAAQATCDEILRSSTDTSAVASRCL